MTDVFLGLGSNVRPEEFLPKGFADLEQRFGVLQYSPVYSGPAIGFDGAPFWNCVVALSTELPLGELQQLLRAIEYAHGRPEKAPRYSDRTLDIDLLTYGQACGVIDGVALARGEILERAFVLRPLAELAPEERHPETGLSYAQHWAAFDQASQPLERVYLTRAAPGMRAAER